MKNRTEKIQDFLQTLNTEIDVAYFVDAAEVESYDDIVSAIEEGNGFDQEVIYYSTAMEYLMEHDTSLQESMGLAAELGYSPDGINSELLASLLKTQNVRSEFQELETEIEDFFAELNDEEEE